MRRVDASPFAADPRAFSAKWKSNTSGSRVVPVFRTYHTRDHCNRSFPDSRPPHSRMKVGNWRSSPRGCLGKLVPVHTPYRMVLVLRELDTKACSLPGEHVRGLLLCPCAL